MPPLPDVQLYARGGGAPIRSAPVAEQAETLNLASSGDSSAGGGFSAGGSRGRNVRSGDPRSAPGKGVGGESRGRGLGLPAGVPTAPALGEGDLAGGFKVQAPAEREVHRDDRVATLGAELIQTERSNRDAYSPIVDNPFVSPLAQPLSTFSIDVDTASYANVRRYLQSGQLPPKDAVRIEEMLNYFRYDYPAPAGEHPFSVNVETAPAPWQVEHRLMRIGLRGHDIDMDERPPTNLVFLIDVSGSMNRPEKLPLLKQAFKLLIDRLTPDDKVGIVVYAGASGLVLEPTYCFQRQTILDALDRLKAGGSTNGGEGIQLAFGVASEHFIEGGINRVILATDGDFNVGVTDAGALVRLAEEKRETGVFLSVLGFGTGNFQDDRMEAISNAGNGNFAYIDSLAEAEKVLVQELGGTLVTIAKDVKIQVEFNPAQVEAYRLIGYENRILAAQDFNDDTKDAGEIGAGHTVTALYEIIPGGTPTGLPSVDELEFQAPGEILSSDATAVVKLRYKQPDGETSTLIREPVTDAGTGLDDSSDDFRFASAVAAFGMILRDSPHRGGATFESVLDLAAAGLGDEQPDQGGYRAQFLDLIERARHVRDLPAVSAPPTLDLAVPLTKEQVDAMTRAEAREMLSLVSRWRRIARANNDIELGERLNQDWTLLLERLENEPR
jgi:Ca-activated chloride channel family protein